MRLFSSLAFMLLLRGVFKASDELEAEFLKDTTDASAMTERLLSTTSALALAHPNG